MSRAPAQHTAPRTQVRVGLICVLFAFYSLSACLFLLCDLSGGALLGAAGPSWNHL